MQTRLKHRVKRVRVCCWNNILKRFLKRNGYIKKNRNIYYLRVQRDFREFKYSSSSRPGNRVNNCFYCWSYILRLFLSIKEKISGNNRRRQFKMQYKRGNCWPRWNRSDANLIKIWKSLVKRGIGKLLKIRFRKIRHYHREKINVINN